MGQSQQCAFFLLCITRLETFKVQKLFENWRRYLNELSEPEATWFGPAFKMLSEDPELAWDPGWIQSNIGGEVGSGYSRTVYNIDSHPELVFKVAHPWEKLDGSYTNAEEKSWFNRFPEFFPRVWLSAESVEPSITMARRSDFDYKEKDIKKFQDKKFVPWIIIDKVRVLNTEQEIADLLEKKLPVFKKISQILDNYGYKTTAQTPYLPSIFAWSLDKDYELVVPHLKGDDDAAAPGTGHKSGWVNKMSEADAVEINQMLDDDSGMAMIRRMIGETDMDSADIRIGNLGTDVATGKKLIFIDINKFLFEI